MTWNKHTEQISIKEQGNGMDDFSNQKRKDWLMIKYDLVHHDIFSSNNLRKIWLTNPNPKETTGLKSN